MAIQNGDGHLLVGQPPPRRRKKPEQSDLVRMELLTTLLATAVDGKHPHGLLKELSLKFRVSRMFIWRLWSRSGASRAAGRALARDYCSRKKLCGWKGKYSTDEMKESLKGILLRHRMTVRATAKRLGVSHMTVQRLKEKKEFRRFTSNLRPVLTEINQVARLMFCLDEINESTMDYKDMYDRIHIDEKWFYMCRDKQSYILANDEKDPCRRVKNKLHIQKVRHLLGLKSL